METSIIYLIIFGIISGLSEGIGVLPDDPITQCKDGKVLFNTNLSLTETPFISVGWRYGADKNIITSGLEVNNTAPEYEGRITLFRFNGSLELRDLTLNDSGVYRVNVFTAGGLPQTGSTKLDIYESVSVTLTPQTADLVEVNSSISLSCSLTGLSFIYWMNGSSEVRASDTVQINTTDRGSTLTIINVTRYDQGIYKCHPLCSNITELPEVNISVSYGPENIKVDPLENSYEVGSNIKLNCSAASKPPAQFMWLLNEDLLPDSGPELELMNVQTSQSGKYSCQAFNSKTLRYQTSQPLVLSVVEINTPSSGLSAGAIAGIVIACLVVVVAAGVGVYYCVRKKKTGQEN